ncbi:MAG: FHA domain-containing protein [Leptolyngbya sp. BL-A-14]
MLNLKPSSDSDRRTLNFLEKNPALSQCLLEDCGTNLSQVSTIIEPVLSASSRCEISSFYIQAVTTGRTAFLTTNLPDDRATHVTSVGSSWLIGRSSNCAISINSLSISRCHAVIGHCPDRGFYIMDVGSSNGTFVNCRRLAALEQRILNDGDLVELSHTRFEFFISGQVNSRPAHQDTQV